MNDTNSTTKQEVLNEIEGDIARYRRYRKYSSILQWVILLLVAIAGFFTTAAGGIGTGEMAKTWFSSANWLTIWGLIAVIGSLVVQNANPAQMAATFEKKKDVMRAIRTALKFRGLEVKVAAKLMETARTDPEKALDELAGHES
jgi:hypothetical protein